MNADYSIGVSVGGDGTVFDSIKNGLAFQAGVMPGMKVVAINDRAFTADLLHQALKASKDNSVTMRLLVLNDDYYKSCAITYQGGERYPHLLRVEAKPDTLDDLAKPLAK